MSDSCRGGSQLQSELMGGCVAKKPSPQPFITANSCSICAQQQFELGPYKLQPLPNLNLDRVDVMTTWNPCVSIQDAMFGWRRAQIAGVTHGFPRAPTPPDDHRLPLCLISDISATVISKFGRHRPVIVVCHPGGGPCCPNHPANVSA